MRKGHFEGENNSGGFSEKQLDISMLREKNEKMESEGEYDMAGSLIIPYVPYRNNKLS